MKAVLMSIKPKWCELIASGEKTVEVRKNRPKLETPFKAYIYCTKDNTFAEKTLRGFDENGKAIYYRAHKGKVIGEFVCDKIFPIKVFENGNIQCYDFYNMDRSCLPYDDIADYIGRDNTGYGWHISDLVIYDKPKELFEFITPTECKSEVARKLMCNTCCLSSDFCTKKPKRIARPPQSWAYVEEVER